MRFIPSLRSVIHPHLPVVRFQRILPLSNVAYTGTLGDIFLKNLLLKCFWWALRNKEFDFLIFKRGGIMCFLRYRSENNF